MGQFDEFRQVYVDESRLLPTEAIQHAARLSPFVILSHTMWTALTLELGSEDDAALWVFALAKEISRPVGVNETDQTVLIAPPDWSGERLAGWVGTYHVAIESAFGQTTGVEIR